MVEQELFGSIISSLESASNELFSGTFYANLNNYEKLRLYYPDCTALDAKYSGIKYQKLRILCAQLVKYLKTTHTTFKREENKYDPCILLNYWFYSKLVSILDTEDKNVIVPALGILEGIWNDAVYNKSDKSLYNKCIPEGRIAAQNDWKKRKELYEYCVNYDTIEKTIPFFVPTCPKYWSYVESHTSLFEYFKTLCTKQNDQCPNFYDQCQKYDPKHVLPTFVCNEQMMKKKAENTAANARSTLPAGMPAGQEASSGMSNSSDISSGGLQSPHNGTHPAKKTGDILLGVVATSLASGALYRFTPLGNMLRNGFGRNNNNMRNMHGGEYALFDYASESFNPYAGGGEEHYIGYHPA
uniref:Variable surface protein vir 4 n=1 Tax=Plasmodium vivax TaxID=5855 RepID=I6NX27_PLAVI|nr:variable surface protein vir 4 [Plasmodium vivax]AFD10453.1 variable surface protein vir 4 [Plasmodium vivax]